MQIKHTAITATIVIESLLKILENENFDISSVKFQIGSESPKFELEKLIDLAINGLDEIKQKNDVSEGFVLVPKEPTQPMIDAAKNTAFFYGDRGPTTMYRLMINAWEQSK